MIRRLISSRTGLLTALGALILGAFAWQTGAASAIITDKNSYDVEYIVSDLTGHARRTDPNLVNPWGIAYGPLTGFWVANAGTSVSTIYTANGQPLPPTVEVPSGCTVVPDSIQATQNGATQGYPTGIVYNGSNNFKFSNTALPGTAVPSEKPAAFIYANLDGTIAAWNNRIDQTHAVTVVNNCGDAVYTGLAIAALDRNTSYLYAANFQAGSIDIFDGNFDPATLAGSFQDPNLPYGYVPFNIQNLGGKLYVAYAKEDDDEADTGPGLGIVSVFDLQGRFIRRIATGGALNAPWGLAIAPANWGPFSNHLLVGNFGDGMINAYNLATLANDGHLLEQNGEPVEIEGLWGLTFGNGILAGEKNTLYFAAGIDDENHGVFGSITWAP